MRQVAGTLGVVGALCVAAVLLTAGSAASSGVKLHVVARGGVVSAYGMHFRCRGSCSLTAAPGSDVLLEARPNRYFSFSHWRGACRGKATACALSLSSASTARAIFRRNTSHVLVAVGGAGSVRVVGRSEAGCGTAAGSCEISWPIGTTIRLAAIPDAGGSFAGWGGACASASGPTCRIVVANTFDREEAVTAAFATGGAGSGDQQLNLKTQNAGVNSSQLGLACRGESQCSISVAAGTLVKLQASRAAGGQDSAPWSGACVGFGYTCALVVDGPTDITGPNLVPFGHAPKDGLIVVVSGHGTVSDATHQIHNCTMTSPQPNCQGTFTGLARLRATAADGNIFSTWRFATCPPKRATCNTQVTGQSGTTIEAVFKQKR